MKIKIYYKNLEAAHFNKSIPNIQNADTWK